VRGAKFLLVPRCVLLTALLNPLMCFLTFFECNLSSPKALTDLDSPHGAWTFSFVELQTLKEFLLVLKIVLSYANHILVVEGGGAV